MRQAFAPKQGHESWSERRQALKEISERPFSADGIADQQREKIDGFIRSEVSAHQTDLLCKGFKQVLRREMLREDDLIARTTQAPRNG
jgi:hypothetical protein